MPYPESCPLLVGTPGRYEVPFCPAQPRRLQRSRLRWCCCPGGAKGALGEGAAVCKERQIHFHKLTALKEASKAITFSWFSIKISITMF